jgi:hypothetical protein
LLPLRATFLLGLAGIRMGADDSPLLLRTGPAVSNGLERPAPTGGTLEGDVEMLTILIAVGFFLGVLALVCLWAASEIRKAVIE